VGAPPLVAGQDVEPAEDSDGRRRITRDTAPDRIRSSMSMPMPMSKTTEPICPT
jgi:hypothetical protein